MHCGGDCTIYYVVKMEKEGEEDNGDRGLFLSGEDLGGERRGEGVDELIPVCI